jgi:hypothetical protein
MFRLAIPTKTDKTLVPIVVKVTVEIKVFWMGEVHCDDNANKGVQVDSQPSTGITQKSNFQVWVTTRQVADRLQVPTWG